MSCGRWTSAMSAFGDGSLPEGHARQLIQPVDLLTLSLFWRHYGCMACRSYLKNGREISIDDIHEEEWTPMKGSPARCWQV